MTNQAPTNMSRFKKTEFLNLNEFINKSIITSQNDKSYYDLFLEIETILIKHDFISIFPSLSKEILDWKSRDLKVDDRYLELSFDSEQITISTHLLINEVERRLFQIAFEISDYIISKKKKDLYPLIQVIADFVLNVGLTQNTPF